MKYPETARRLSYILNLRNMTAQELSNKSGVGKSSISHYVNGNNEPHNRNAGAMADVLKCDPRWLMGYDVEMIPEQPAVEHLDYYVVGVTDIAGEIPGYTEKGYKIQKLFPHLKALNADGIEKLIDRAKELEEVPRYRMDNVEKGGE